MGPAAHQDGLTTPSGHTGLTLTGWGTVVPSVCVTHTTVGGINNINNINNMFQMFYLLVVGLLLAPC